MLQNALHSQTFGAFALADASGYFGLPSRSLTDYADLTGREFCENLRLPFLASANKPDVTYVSPLHCLRGPLLPLR